MKRYDLRSKLGSFLTCAVAVGMMAPGIRAIAQAPTTHVVANVPFDFRSGSQVLPAGKYDLIQLSDHFMTIRGVNQNRSQVLICSGAETVHPSNHAKLVFHKYGDKYYLYQLWGSGRTSGIEFPKGRAEKEMLRAEIAPAPSLTELALNEEPKR